MTPDQSKREPRYQPLSASGRLTSARTKPLERDSCGTSVVVWSAQRSGPFELLFCAQVEGAKGAALKTVSETHTHRAFISIYPPGFEMTCILKHSPTILRSGSPVILAASY